MKSQELTTFLDHANRELQKYNSTKELIYLQQMSEKMWNACILLIKAVSNKKIKTHKGVGIVEREIKDKNLDTLYETCNDMHVFFYESDDDAYLIKKKYIRARKLFKMLRKKYKV